MPKVKEYTTREVIAIFKNNGYRSVRSQGGHGMFSNGINTISIPIHNKNINRMMFKRLVKEFNLAI